MGCFAFLANSLSDKITEHLPMDCFAFFVSMVNGTFFMVKKKLSAWQHL